MPFRVWIRHAVEHALDGWLTFDGASQMMSDLYRVLRHCPDELREDRAHDEPEAFHWRLTVIDGGFRHYLDFTICDRWQEGWMHVVAVARTPGGRAFHSLGPL
jgi:hypothetical protein